MDVGQLRVSTMVASLPWNLPTVPESLNRGVLAVSLAVTSLQWESMEVGVEVEEWR